MVKVTIIDYGMGNILSVVRSFECCGGVVEVTCDKKKIMKADYLVLPGVGAFKNAMDQLKKLDLIEAIQSFTKKGNPFLGICLGMQMMMESSNEFGYTEGLGLIPGVVERIEGTTIDGLLHKVPHVGWNKLLLPDGKEQNYWSNSILKKNDGSEYFYFVHSYTAKPEKTFRLADSNYGGRLLSAVIRKENAYGCQFHPEKSGEDGLKIISNFITL